MSFFGNYGGGWKTPEAQNLHVRFQTKSVANGGLSLASDLAAARVLTAVNLNSGCFQFPVDGAVPVELLDGYYLKMVGCSSETQSVSLRRCTDPMCRVCDARPFELNSAGMRNEFGMIAKLATDEIAYGGVVCSSGVKRRARSDAASNNTVGAANDRSGRRLGSCSGYGSGGGESWQWECKDSCDGVSVGDGGWSVGSCCDGTNCCYPYTNKFACAAAVSAVAACTSASCPTLRSIMLDHHLTDAGTIGGLDGNAGAFTDGAMRTTVVNYLKTTLRFTYTDAEWSAFSTSQILTLGSQTASVWQLREELVKKGWRSTAEVTEVKPPSVVPPTHAELRAMVAAGLSFHGTSVSSSDITDLGALQTKPGGRKRTVGLHITVVAPASFSSTAGWADTDTPYAARGVDIELLSEKQPTMATTEMFALASPTTAQLQAAPRVTMPVGTGEGTCQGYTSFPESIHENMGRGFFPIAWAVRLSASTASPVVRVNGYVDYDGKHRWVRENERTRERENERERGRRS